MNPNRRADPVPPPADEDAVPGLSALNVDCEPRTDLWPGIESRLRPRPSAWLRRWAQTSWLVAAGFAALATFAAVMTFERLNTPVPTDVAALGAPAAGAPEAASTQVALVPVMVHPLHAESRALVRANLKIVNNAEVQVRRAMLSQPDAAYLRSLLSTAHEQKRELKMQLAMGDRGDLQ